MESLSNKTLAGLLVLAIIISLAGTLLSLEKFYVLEQEMVATGLVVQETKDFAESYARQYGTEEHTISSEYSQDE